MSDEIFRIIVASGVVLASIAFVVQAGILLALYRASRQMQEKTAAFMGRIDPVMNRVGPALDKAGPILDKIGPVIEKIGPVIEKIGPVVEKIGPVIEKIGPVIQKVSVALDRVPPVIDKVQVVVGQAGTLVQRATLLTESANHMAVTANNVMLDSRPQLKDMTTEAAAIVHTSREQVERIGELLHDAGELARNRIQQIDDAVTSTVDHVEHVGETVKSAVLRPVREVNGLAAGISAAVSTLVRGQRKSSVDAATQDEEMFI